MLQAIAIALLAAVPVDYNRQREVLDHYVGEWDVEFTLEATDANNTDQEFSGSVVGKWIVEKNFVDQTGRYSVGDQQIVIKTIMSFDADRDEYHFWYFLSDGQIRESIGKWNQEKMTMTSEMKDPNSDNVVTIVADFSKPGVESWTIDTKRVDGKTISRIRGVNTKR